MVFAQARATIKKEGYSFSEEVTMINTGKIGIIVSITQHKNQTRHRI